MVLPSSYPSLTKMLDLVEHRSPTHLYLRSEVLPQRVAERVVRRRAQQYRKYLRPDGGDGNRYVYTAGCLRPAGRDRAAVFVVDQDVYSMTGGKSLVPRGVLGEIYVGPPEETAMWLLPALCPEGDQGGREAAAVIWLCRKPDYKAVVTVMSVAV